MGRMNSSESRGSGRKSAYRVGAPEPFVPQGFVRLSQLNGTRATIKPAFPVFGDARLDALAELRRRRAAQMGADIERHHDRGLDRARIVLAILGLHRVRGVGVDD